MLRGPQLEVHPTNKKQLSAIDAGNSFHSERSFLFRLALQSQGRRGRGTAAFGLAKLWFNGNRQRNSNPSLLPCKSCQLLKTKEDLFEWKAHLTPKSDQAVNDSSQRL